MSNNENNNDFLKGMVIGSLVGGAVGALVALLYAPKPGVELRKDISEKSTELYGKASDYFSTASETVQHTAQTIINQGKEKAQAIVDSARKQADELMHRAQGLIVDAKDKASQVQSGVKEGVDAFKREIN
jgi:gas vesicle protein